MNNLNDVAPWGASARKTLTFTKLDFNTAEGVFKGYGARFGNLDKTGDVIEPGAFTKTLRDAEARRKASGNPALFSMLWMHKPELPIGVILSAHEDAKGLYIEGRCDLNTDLGKSAFSGISQGYSTQLSIGYDAVKVTRDKQGIRHLWEVKLWEISLVTSGFAANELASVDTLSVKSAVGGERVPVWLEAVARDMRAWRARQPVAQPPVAVASTPTTEDDPAPKPLNYFNHDVYEAARDAWEARWLARYYAPALAALTPKATPLPTLRKAPRDPAWEAERDRIVRTLGA